MTMNGMVMVIAIAAGTGTFALYSDEGLTSETSVSILSFTV